MLYGTQSTHLRLLIMDERIPTHADINYQLAVSAVIPFATAFATNQASKTQWPTSSEEYRRAYDEHYHGYMNRVCHELKLRSFVYQCL